MTRSNDASPPHYDVMTPMTLASGKEVWVKLGVAWNEPERKHAVLVSLSTLPIGHQGELRLFLYPTKERAK
jgi:hypothetical protein